MATIRKAVPEDYHRIAEIAAAVWEGHDYVARAFSSWVYDSQGQFVVIELDGVVQGCARLTMLNCHDAWLEGLRISPAARGMGLAQQLTDYLVDFCRQRGVHSLRLSVDYDNYPSVHISKKHGFRNYAAFNVMEKGLNSEAQPAVELEKLYCPQEVLAVLDQRVLQQRRYLASFDWVFQEINSSLIEELTAEGSVFGLREQGEIAALMFLSKRYAKEADGSISFIQGSDYYSELIAWGCYQAQSWGWKTLLTMCPADPELKQAFAARGFEASAEVPDVLVMEHQSTLCQRNRKSRERLDRQV